MRELYMAEWKKITNEKLIMHHPSGFSVIKPLLEYDCVPFDCPVCKLVMRDHLDVTSHHRSECCRECEHIWADPFRDKWDLGWRPSADEVKEQRRSSYDFKPQNVVK